jgi:hypothetical protein
LSPTLGIEQVSDAIDLPGRRFKSPPGLNAKGSVANDWDAAPLYDASSAMG